MIRKTETSEYFKQRLESLAVQGYLKEFRSYEARLVYFRFTLLFFCGPLGFQPSFPGKVRTLFLYSNPLKLSKLYLSFSSSQLLLLKLADIYKEKQPLKHRPSSLGCLLLLHIAPIVLYWILSSDDWAIC